METQKSEAYLVVQVQSRETGMNPDIGLWNPALHRPAVWPRLGPLPDLCLVLACFFPWSVLIAMLSQHSSAQPRSGEIWH